jgi:2-polyprenyl-3-methyl-5-hydroxy-6-metoxy-1,4-benzoquinol methylase
MKVAVMQTYFFPYLGYFSLIDSSDHFVFFDDVQFRKKSWMSRNRLLDISKSTPFYIRPEISKSDYQCNMMDVELSQNGNWQKKLLSQIEFYKNFKDYNEIRDLLIDILDNTKYLCDFNINSTIAISKYLGIKTKFSRFSEHNFQFSDLPLGKGDWGRETANAIGATHYINAPGGEEFIFSDKFEEMGMKLGFIQPNLKKYEQNSKEFVIGLSILDVLFCNGKEKTLEMVKDYNVKWSGVGYWENYYNTDVVNTNNNQTNVGRTKNGKPISEVRWGETINHIKSQIELKETDDIIEFCCGNGMVLGELSKISKSAFGIDYSEKLLEQLNNNYSDVKYVWSDVTKYDLKDTIYDKMIMYFSAQHFDESELIELIKKMLNNLKGDGIILIGDVPDESKKWDYINTPEYKADYFRRILNKNPMIGNWYSKEWFLSLNHFLLDTEVVVVEQPEFMINSDWRFDVLIKKY